MFAELGREKAGQAYAFQNEMVKKCEREVCTHTEDIRRKDAKRE